MKVAFYSTKDYDERFFKEANNKLPEQERHEFTFFECNLDERTAELLACHEAQTAPYDAVCVFVNDDVGARVIDKLVAQGVKFIALRCAGCNNVDVEYLKAKTALSLVHVPAYSPNAVAEHALALLLTLNRKTHKVYNRVREGDFSLQGVTPGYDLVGKTVGVIGTGRIGQAFIRIMMGLGCHVLGYDGYENPELVALQQLGHPGFGTFKYTTLEEVFKQADIISLHLPLTPKTRFLINRETISTMKKGVVLLNTSRGALVDTKAVIEALKTKHIGAIGLDTYEEEEELFYRNLSQDIVADDQLIRLMTFPNVIITPHQGFYTQEALSAIAKTTLRSFDSFAKGQQPESCMVYKGQVVTSAA